VFFVKEKWGRKGCCCFWAAAAALFAAAKREEREGVLGSLDEERERGFYQMRLLSSSPSYL